MDTAAFDASVRAEIASVIGVLDLLVKYEAWAEKLLPGVSVYLPLAVKYNAALKAAQAVLVAA
jgi:hypothetical protein